MTIRILTIPDDQTQWPGWLEQQLVGSHLRELIEELRIVQESDSSLSGNMPLGEILTNKQMSGIADSGLASIGITSIQQLLGNPDALLDLQEHVLINGGSYWQAVPVDLELTASVERVRGNLSASCGDKQPAPKPNSVDGEVQQKTNRRLFAWLASAAAILLAGVVLWRLQPHPSGHILGSPGLVANNTSSAAEYLQRIAAAGGQWFVQKPQDVASLISLLEDTSNDCQILINARHEALSPDQREWFVTKCLKWKGEFDATLAALKSGAITFDAAQSRANQTMEKLVKVLNAGPTA